MGRRNGRRFDRRPEDEYASNNVSMTPLSNRKGRRSGQRTRPSNTRVTDGSLELSCDLERGSRRNEHPPHDSQKTDRRNSPRRHAKLNRNNIIKYVLVAAFILFASFNYMISQSTNMASPGGNDRQQPSNWSQKKIDEKAEHFIRTGELPGTKRLASSVIGQRRESRVDADNSNKEGTSQEMKQNRSVHGAKPTNGIEEWPPLSSLIDAHGNIADGANISGLLDFSIIGFPKAATTSVFRHLSDFTNSLPTERCDLVVNDTVKLVRDIYDDHAKRMKQSKDDTAMEKQMRGIKCPQDISSEWSMHNYAKYFPRTKLIVGIRHPIWQFESLYNFRVSNVPWKKMLPTSKLTKGCQGGSQGVCAWRSNFHDFLARLGKTPLSSPSELKLLSLAINPAQHKVGPVFLYDMSQLSEVKFRKDLRDFLGLTRDIPPFPAIDTSGRFDHISSIKRRTASEKIDICNPEHAAIRSVLMKKATSASIWIGDYFLKSEDVFVSNRPYFESVLKSWKNDPC